MRDTVAVVGILTLVVLAGVLVSSCAREQAPSPDAMAVSGPARAPEPPADQESAAAAETVKCSVCGRECEARRAVLARTKDKQYQFCCAFCLAKHIEAGLINPEKDEIVFHDYVTGEEVSPGDALIVEDSDVDLKCRSAVLVLKGRECAEAFVKEHGGSVLSWADYLAREMAEESEGRRAKQR